MKFSLNDVIVFVLILLSSGFNYCELDPEDFRSAFGVTFQTAPSHVNGNLLEFVGASSLVHCSHICLNEPLCKDTVWREQNMCLLLTSGEGNVDVTSKLQEAGVYAKFERAVTEINKGTSDSEVCGKGYVAFNNSGIINCFKPHNERVTWWNAQAACERNGAYLAR